MTSQAVETGLTGGVAADAAALVLAGVQVCKVARHSAAKANFSKLMPIFRVITALPGSFAESSEQYHYGCQVKSTDWRYSNG